MGPPDPPPPPGPPVDKHIPLVCARVPRCEGFRGPLPVPQALGLQPCTLVLDVCLFRKEWFPGLDHMDIYDNVVLLPEMIDKECLDPGEAIEVCPEPRQSAHSTAHVPISPRHNMRRLAAHFPEHSLWGSPPPPPHHQMHLVNSTGNSPSLGQPTPGVVKQDKSSGGSVDTTKTCSDPRRVRMCKGQRPIGTAKGKRPNTEALCHPPPPLAYYREFRGRHGCL